MSELTDLIVNERNHIGCEPYGNALKKVNFSQGSHFINIQREKSEKYNVGSFKLKDGVVKKYNLDFEKYSAIGASYRDKCNKSDSVRHSNSQNFSYENVHLGINAQNLTHDRQ